MKGIVTHYLVCAWWITCQPGLAGSIAKRIRLVINKWKPHCTNFYWKLLKTTKPASYSLYWGSVRIICFCLLWDYVWWSLHHTYLSTLNSEWFCIAFIGHYSVFLGVPGRKISEAFVLQQVCHVVLRWNEMHRSYTNQKETESAPVKWWGRAKEMLPMPY